MVRPTDIANLTQVDGPRTDNAGRLTSTTAGGKTLAYQYDPAGTRPRTTWPEATPRSKSLLTQNLVRL